MPVIDLDSAIDMNTTYGALLVGLVCSAALYGVTMLQTFIYYRKYPQDSTWLKFIVGLLAVLDTLHLLFCTIAVYWYLITNYSNPKALGRQIWALNLQTDFNGLAGYIVQTFFARRVYRLSGKNMYLAGVIFVLATVHFSLGVVFTIEEFILVETAKFHKLIWVTVVGLGSAAGADILIAVSLCYYLMSNKTGFTRTDSLIGSLVSYSLTTGLLSGIIALICVVCFAIMPSNYVWLAFFWLIGKVYVNSLLAALNSRDYLRERFSGHDGTVLRFAVSRSRTYSNAGQVVPLQRRVSEKSDIRSCSPAITANARTEATSNSDYK